jgi:hypothetical protein
MESELIRALAVEGLTYWLLAIPLGLLVIIGILVWHAARC